MNKILLSLTLALGLFGIAQATVPQRRQFTHKQPDGTSLRLTSVANGRYITYATTDGLAVLRGTDGNFYYAQPAAGEWQCTTHLAHNQAERTTAETALLSKHSLPIEAASQMLANRYPAPRLQRATRSEASTADGLGTYKQSAPGTVCSIGSPVIPVVMVNFADRTFTDTIDATKVTRFFNEQGYADEQGSKGSVKDYFTAQSQGLFTPTFSVVATVTLPKGYAYYGANSTSGRIDEHITDFITDALAQAEKRSISRPMPPTAKSPSSVSCLPDRANNLRSKKAARTTFGLNSPPAVSRSIRVPCASTPTSWAMNSCKVTVPRPTTLLPLTWTV